MTHSKLVIRNVHLYDPEPGQLFHVTCAGGVVTAIERVADTESTGPESQTGDVNSLDAKGQGLLLPRSGGPSAAPRSN